MPTRLSPAEDKYTPQQMREAMTIVNRAKKGKGQWKDWPEWVDEARKQYNRTWQRNSRLERQAKTDLEGRKINYPLLDDGIVDWEAVRIAVNGLRVVRMTRNERLIAVAYMRDVLELRFFEIGERLGVKEPAHYIREIENGKVKDLLAALEREEIDQSGDPLKFN
jgi:hypothetical protein